MNIYRLRLSSHLFVIAGVLLFLLTNCQKPPTPEFSYTPVTNPEAGDSIKFTNESIEALTYEWDFGNGTSSTIEHPFVIYEDPGNVDVTLTATNEAGSISITKSLGINRPTILGFYVFEDDTTTQINNCEVWVYDNQSDFEAFNEPQFFKFTDSEGFAQFQNMEAQAYYVIVYKETDTGIWIAGGSTSSLTLNEENLFLIVSVFLPDEAKKSLKSKLDNHYLHQEILPNLTSVIN